MTSARLLAVLLALETIAVYADTLPEAFTALSRNERWKIVESTPLQFETWHPQGLTRAGERFYLSSVQTVNRAQAEGRGHLFVFNAKGELLDRAEFGEGPIYHPGGIDFDGGSIWLSLAEYRPDSHSIVYRIDPKSLAAEEVFRFDDHLGAVVHVPAGNLLIGASWGSEWLYRWRTETTAEGEVRVPDPQEPHKLKNPVQYISYQDLQLVPGSTLILASGLQRYRQPGRGGTSLEVGGIDLIEAPTLRLKYGLPIHLWTDSGESMNRNPFLVERAGGGIQFRFVPEDNASVMYTVQPR